MTGRTAVAALWDQLDRIGEPLDRDLVAAVLHEHARLTDALADAQAEIARDRGLGWPFAPRKEHS